AIAGAKRLLQRKGPEQAERGEYVGSHTAPGASFGAPAHDLTGGGEFYPDDVYGPMGARYYGDGEESLDRQTMAILSGLRGKPNAKVKIYRAVPVTQSGEEITLNEGD